MDRPKPILARPVRIENRTYATLTLVDGRQAAIMKKIRRGFEILPLGGATFRPGERFDMVGFINGKETVGIFVVGAKCGPGKRCVRIRGEKIKE